MDGFAGGGGGGGGGAHGGGYLWSLGHPLPSVIAQPRCTVSEVQENRSSPDHRHPGGESASSADKVLARNMSARCTGAVHAAHYGTRVLISHAARGAAMKKKQQTGGRRRRLPVGPGPHMSVVESIVHWGASSIFLGV